MIQASLHKLFGAFQLYLEWVSNQVRFFFLCDAANDNFTQIFIRARTGAADPPFDLAAVVNDQRRICDEPGALIDTPLRPRRNETIPDIRMKFFVLHKFIGDIVWMCGGAGTDYDEEKEEDEENLKVLSNYNFDEIVRKLNSPGMNFLSREGMFGRIWVPKEVEEEIVSSKQIMKMDLAAQEEGLQH